MNKNPGHIPGFFQSYEPVTCFDPAQQKPDDHVLEHPRETAKKRVLFHLD
jgi:hypothetical protein